MQKSALLHRGLRISTETQSGLIAWHLARKRTARGPHGGGSKIIVYLESQTPYTSNHRPPSFLLTIRWRLRVVYSRALPMLSIFREKILKSNFGSRFEFWGNIGIRYKSYFLTPKGTSLCDYASYESLSVKIHQKPQERHKTSNLPICPEVLCKRILTKFGTWDRWSDVINCAEFFGNQFRVLIL